nr:chitin-binding protein [Cellana toreuma]
MFWWILAAAIASVSCGGLRAPEFNCSGIEGLAWWACKSYGECRGGSHVQNDCPDGTAFDQQFSCVDVNSAPFPCNLDRTAECENIGAMVTSIAEQDQGGQDPPCSFFYTCNNGHFVGHQKCPSGLVFDEDKQICGDPANVPSPCGFGNGNGNNGGNFGRNLNGNNNYGNGGNNGGYGGNGGSNGNYGSGNNGNGGGYGGSNGNNGNGGGYGGSNGNNGGYGGYTDGYGGSNNGNSGYNRNNGGTGGTGGGNGGSNGNYGNNGGYGGSNGGNTGGWGGGYTESYPKRNNYNYNY